MKRRHLKNLKKSANKFIKDKKINTMMKKKELIYWQISNEKYVPKHLFSFVTKELSLCHKFWIYNPYIFGTQCRKSLIFQTYINLSNRIHSLEYLRSTTLESKDTGFRKAEFVAKTQFLYLDILRIFFI